MIVITEKDIKLSGAASIQDLFRSLPGIDLALAAVVLLVRRRMLKRPPDWFTIEGADASSVNNEPISVDTIDAPSPHLISPRPVSPAVRRLVLAEMANGVRSMISSWIRNL